MLKFALAGNPNCGKTTLFNNLTGSTAYVGNWPGVTVDKREGVYKKCAQPITIVDLPGIYSLSPYTPEEVISRNFVLDEAPDCIVNIVDATNLERNLYLSTQLLETDVPIVIALNMTDLVKKNGDSVDAKALSERIGVPVVSVSTLKGDGVDELMKVAYAVCAEKRVGTDIFAGSDLGVQIGKIRDMLIERGEKNAVFHAVKIVEGDELETEKYSEAASLMKSYTDARTADAFEGDYEAEIADLRYKYISANFSPVYKKRPDNKADKQSASDRADKVLTNKWAGIPIFLLIMFAVFHLTFSENFLFLGGLFPDWVSLEGTTFEGVFGNGGIASPGVALQNLLWLGTDTLTELVAGAMSSAPDWLSGLVCDGILSGLFSVLSFLPQILLLFLFFSILEDSGYMARVAFILDRIFRKFGLSGRAFMPMIMGFGCSVPAMINTRTLADDNERTATVRVIPFFSCGAKLPILTAIAGGIVMRFGVGNADIITYSMYVLGVVTAIVSVILMRRTTMRGEVPPFIMELPAYHAPQFKALMIHLWDKLKHFVKKAFTIILASTIVIWFISHFSFSWEYLPDEEIRKSILAGFGQLLQPLFTPLGFGSQLKSMGWVFVVAAITGLIAKENVVATFGTLAACIVAGFEGDEEGIQAAVQMIIATEITIPALLSFIAFNMTTIPCFAAVATAKAELPKGKFAGTLVFWLVASYLVGSAIYIIGSWWWTCFIYAALTAGLIAWLVLHNRSLDKKKAIGERA